MLGERWVSEHALGFMNAWKLVVGRAVFKVSQIMAGIWRENQEKGIPK